MSPKFSALLLFFRKFCLPHSNLYVRLFYEKHKNKLSHVSFVGSSEPAHEILELNAYEYEQRGRIRAVLVEPAMLTNIMYIEYGSI